MDYPRKVWRSAGIYAILNTKNGKPYIGQTRKTFRYRWAVHRNLLNKGEHSNAGLQKDWIVYGADSFDFQILEVLDWRDYVLICEREWAHLGMYSSVYNIADPPRSLLDYDTVARVCAGPMGDQPKKD